MIPTWIIHTFALIGALTFIGMVALLAWAAAVEAMRR